MYEGKYKVGDRVKVVPKYPEDHDRDDLVVLYMDEDVGYGIGPEGNDPHSHHNPRYGWLWYNPEEVLDGGENLISLDREEFLILPMFAYEGEKSLDAIATKFYGKEYKGQQTGDMIANDSHMVYDMSTDDEVEEYQPEDCYKPLSRWLALNIGDEVVEDWYAAGERKHTLQYDFEVFREAPMPQYILADLIRNGVLPYGKYLVRVSW